MHVVILLSIQEFTKSKIIRIEQSVWENNLFQTEFDAAIQTAVTQ